MGQVGKYVTRWVRNACLIAPLALAVAGLDWLLKAGVIAAGAPHQFHWFYERPPSPLVTAWALAWLIVFPGLVERRAGVIGVALLCGAALGNFGELAALGRVTGFIPLPPGARSSPADLIGVIGLLMLLGDLFLGNRVERRRQLASPRTSR